MALTVAQLVARLTADTSGFYRGMAITNAAMIRTGGIVSRVTAGIGLATVGAGVMAVRAAGNFQQSMNVLQAVSGATEGQFKSLRSEAIDLGRDMKLPNVSAKDAAEAMQELAKGGLNVTQILGATRGTLQLGIAANLGFADSATIVARAISAFGLQGSQAVQVADLFTAAANRSTASMTDIALGFQMASAQFKAGDQDIQALTTSLTLMANAGVIGSDAGTSLKTMMNRLMAPTKKAKDLMKEMGFEVYDSSGNMKRMPDIIGDLNRSLAGMSKEQRNAALYTLFGSDAIRAARIQLDAGRDGWLKMEKAITKGGEAQAFAEAQTKGFNGALQALWSQIETLAIELGTPLLDPLEKALRATATWLGALDTQKIIDFGAAIFDMVAAVIDFFQNSLLAQSAAVGLMSAFLAYRTITWVAGVVRGIAFAVIALNAALLANPFVAIAALLIALGVALYYAYTRSERFREIVNNTFETIRNIVDRVVPAVISSVRGMMDKITREANSWAIVAFIRKHWDSIKTITATIWNTIVTIIRGHMENILAVVRGNLNSLINIVRPLLNVFTAIFRAAYEIIKSTTDNLVGVLTGKISLLRAITNIVGTILTQVTNIFRAQFNLAKTIVTEAIAVILRTIKGLAAAAYNAALAIGSSIVQGIVAGVSGLASQLTSKLTSAISSAKDAVMSKFGMKSPSKVFAKDVGKPIADGIIRGYLLGIADLPTKTRESTRRGLEAARATIDRYRDRMKRAWDRLAGDALRAFDAITSAHMTPTEQFIKQQDAWWETRHLQERLAEAQKELDEALKGGDQEEINRALRAVEEAQWEISRQGLEKQAEQERLGYEASRDLQRRHLEDYLDAQWEALQKSPEQWKTIMDQTMTMLGNYGVTFNSAGRFLGEAFAQGMQESINQIGNAADLIAKVIQRMLKLHSPAREGPLSDLNTWWDPFAETLLEGLSAGEIREALARAIGPPGGGYVPGFAAQGAGGGTTHIHYHIAGSLIAEKDVDSRIREGIISEVRSGRRLPANALSTLDQASTL